MRDSMAAHERMSIQLHMSAPRALLAPGALPALGSLVPARSPSTKASFDMKLNVNAGQLHREEASSKEGSKPE